MDRRSTRSMMVLFAAALAFAAWGCGGSKPNYDTGDGGGAHDAQHDAQHDRGTHPDGEVPDGEAPDGQDDAVVDEGPLIDIFLPLADRHVKDGSIILRFSAKDPYDGLKAEAPSVTLDGQSLAVSGLTTPTAGDLAYSGDGTFTVTSPCATGGFAEGSHTLAVTMKDVGDRMGVATTTVIVDCSGPTLTPITPLEAVIVGGATEFRLKVVDLAGIDDSSVQAEITERPPNPAVVLPLLRPPGLDPTTGEFSIYYQTDNLPQPMIRPQLLWRARDLLGNESWVAYEIALDNARPRVSLTSPVIYPVCKASCWAQCGPDPVFDPSPDPAKKCESSETPLQCARDCATCGDTICSLGETQTSCPQDCQGTCGDGFCDSVGNETPGNCASDCQRSNWGDGVCSLNETCATDPHGCGQCRWCDKYGEVARCARPTDPLATWGWTWNGSVWQRVPLVDGARVPQAFFLRARVEDLGNEVTGDALTPIAGINPSTVRLLVLPRDDRPLAISSSHICDHLNPDLHQTTALTGTDPDEVLTIDMANVPPSPPCTGDFRYFGPSPSPTPPGCCGSYGDLALEDAPKPLCKYLAEDLQSTSVIPGIYSLAPVTDGGPQCQGTQFDAGYLPDGWFCVAVEAEDAVGNRAISKPLHLCLDKGWTDPSVCKQSLPNPCAADAVSGLTDQCDIKYPYEAENACVLVE